MDKKKFLEKSLIIGLSSFENIDLNPETQGIVEVVIFGDNVILNALYHRMEIIKADNFINYYCGSLLANNIDCDSYQEGNWLTDRTYNIKEILKSTFMDYESERITTIMQFTNLCKALITESFKTKNIYRVSLNRVDEYLDYSESSTTNENDIDEELKYIESETENFETLVNEVAQFIQKNRKIQKCLKNK